MNKLDDITIESLFDEEPDQLQMIDTTDKVEDGSSDKFFNLLKVFHTLVNEKLEHGPVLPTTEDPCEKTHKLCGHKCGGVTAERKCLPCLKPECSPKG